MLPLKFIGDRFVKVKEFLGTIPWTRAKTNGQLFSWKERVWGSMIHLNALFSLVQYHALLSLKALLA